MIDFSIADLLGGEPVGLEAVEGRESDDSFRRRLQEVATDPIDRERLWTVIGLDLDVIGLRYKESRRPVTVWREKASED